jgi:hypothetical protein
MAQLTIYLDDTSIKMIEDAAAREKSSVSGWVKKRLLHSLDDQWPAGYFDVFGSLGESDLKRPPQPDFSADAPRESL